MQIPRTQLGFASAGAGLGPSAGSVEGSGIAAGLGEFAKVFAEKEHEAKVARDAADRGIAAAQVGVGTDEITDTVRRIGQGLDDGSISKDAAKAQYKTMTDEVIAKRISQVPEAHQELARVNWQAAIERHSSNIDDLVLKRNQHDVRNALNQIMETASRNPDEVQARQMVEGAFASIGPHSGLPPEQLQKTKQTWLENTQYTKGFTAIEAAGQDKAKIQEAIKSLDTLTDLDPQKKAALVDRGNDRIFRIDERMAREQEAAARRQEAQLKRAEATFNSAMAMADKGVFAESQADTTLKALQGTPYANAFKQIIDQQRVTGALTMQPPTVVQGEIDKLNADIRANGITEAKQRRLGQLEKVKSGQAGDLKDDPLRAFTSRYATQALPPIDASSAMGLATSLQLRAQVAAQASAWSGKDTAPLFKEEIEPVRKMLENLPLKDRADAIGMIAGTVGRSQAAGIAAQIEKDNQPLALAFAASAGGDPQGRAIAAKILKGQQALADKTVLKDEKAVTGWTSQIAKEADGLFWSPKTTESIKAAAYNVAAANAAERGGSASGSAFQKAIEEAAGGKIIEQGKGRIVLPSGMTARELGDRLRSYPVADLKLPDDKVRVAGVEMPAAEFVKTLPGATLTTVGAGKYVVLVPRVAGAKPDLPVTNTKGEPVMIGVAR